MHPTRTVIDWEKSGSLILLDSNDLSGSFGTIDSQEFR